VRPHKARPGPQGDGTSHADQREAWYQARKKFSDIVTSNTLVTLSIRLTER